MASALLLLTLLLGLVPLLLIFVKPAKTKTTFTKSIMPIAILMFFASVYEFTVSLLFKINPSIWFRIYLLFDFFVIYYFFKILIKQKFKSIRLLFIIVYVLVWIGLWFIWEQENSLKTDAYLTLIESLFVYTFAIIWFRDLFSKATVESLWQTPEFYLIFGLIFYFAATTFLFLLSGNMLETTGFKFEKYWLINVIGNFILRSLLIVGIWKSQRK